MKRPNAVLFGSDLAAWDETKDMKQDEARHLVPLAPIVPKQVSSEQADTTDRASNSLEVILRSAPTPPHAAWGEDNQRAPGRSHSNYLRLRLDEHHHDFNLRLQHPHTTHNISARDVAVTILLERPDPSFRKTCLRTLRGRKTET